ncbi:MAG: superoxide dismutase [Flammeovirgaceae bacterium TMED290]|nr:MAG: superoxide dismutase [Flammeovirgaceae bacterium TMED290]|tara:strand:+ start:11431 stop:12027 length:597 start_codon:yes stop_codon:yes gene_type:complete
MSFTLPDLPYSYDALEPHFDSQTMEIHHSRHHNLYITNLNNAIEGTNMENASIEEICKNHSENIAVRNNGGGHYNHSLFWNIISPNGGGDPNGKVAELINSTFNDFDSFKSKFSTAAMTRFGSGWAWLCQIDDHLEICSTANQDNPLMPGICNDQSNPIIGIDVWEHAYYLKYQNKRAEYIDAFFNVVDWNKVNERIS